MQLVELGPREHALVSHADQLGNMLHNDSLKRYFVRGEVSQVLRPVMALEEFVAGPAD